MKTFEEELLERIRSDEELKNLTFIAEGEEIKVNNTLLAASCDFFKKWLFGSTNESKSSMIHLSKETSKEAFKKVIEYIYTSNCDISSIDESQLIQLVGLAHQYQFQRLLDYLFPKIELAKYSVEFCVALFDLVNTCQMKEWKDACLEYFDDIFDSGVDVDIFAKFSRKLVLEITTRDSFSIDECELFECLAKWKEVNQEEQSGGIFKNLRLNLIDISSFNSKIMPTNLIKSNDYLIALEKKPVNERVTKASRGVCLKRTVDGKDVSQLETITLSPKQTLVFEMKKNKTKMNVIRFLVAGGSNNQITVKDNSDRDVPCTMKCSTTINSLFVNGKVNQICNSYNGNSPLFGFGCSTPTQLFLECEVKFRLSTVALFSVTSDNNFSVRPNIECLTE